MHLNEKLHIGETNVRNSFSQLRMTAIAFGLPHQYHSLRLDVREVFITAEEAQRVAGVDLQAPSKATLIELGSEHGTLDRKALGG